MQHTALLRYSGQSTSYSHTPLTWATVKTREEEQLLHSNADDLDVTSLISELSNMITPPSPRTVSKLLRVIDASPVHPSLIQRLKSVLESRNVIPEKKSEDPLLSPYRGIMVPSSGRQNLLIPLEQAIERENPTFVHSLSKEMRAEVLNRFCKGAKTERALAIIRELILYGVDLDAKDKDNLRPIDHFLLTGGNLTRLFNGYKYKPFIPEFHGYANIIDPVKDQASYEHDHSGEFLIALCLPKCRNVMLKSHCLDFLEGSKLLVLSQVFEDEFGSGRHSNHESKVILIETLCRLSNSQVKFILSRLSETAQLHLRDFKSFKSVFVDQINRFVEESCYLRNRIPEVAHLYSLKNRKLSLNFINNFTNSPPTIKDDKFYHLRKVKKCLERCSLFHISLDQSFLIAKDLKQIDKIMEGIQCSTSAYSNNITGSVDTFDRAIYQALRNVLCQMNLNYNIKDLDIDMDLIACFVFHSFDRSILPQIPNDPDKISEWIIEVQPVLQEYISNRFMMHNIRNVDDLHHLKLRGLLVLDKERIKREQEKANEAIAKIPPAFTEDNFPSLQASKKPSKINPYTVKDDGANLGP